ncbi:hypothetical protein MACH09_06040 [Vibrio sp. MACH09]|nr:hypothetical protein MACH09_06040 [Vibrio sp. MACH09]
MSNGEIVINWLYENVNQLTFRWRYLPFRSAMNTITPTNNTTRKPKDVRLPIAPKRGDNVNKAIRAVTSLMVWSRREIIDVN